MKVKMKFANMLLIVISLALLGQVQSRDVSSKYEVVLMLRATTEGEILIENHVYGKGPKLEEVKSRLKRIRSPKGQVRRYLYTHPSLDARGKPRPGGKFYMLYGDSILLNGKLVKWEDLIFEDVI